MKKAIFLCIFALFISSLHAEKIDPKTVDNLIDSNHQIIKEAVIDYAEYIKIDNPYIDFCNLELLLKSKALTRAGLKKTINQYYEADGVEQLNRWLNEKHNYDVSFMQTCLADVKIKLRTASVK